MEVKRFNEKRAEEERRKAAAASTEEARKGYNQIAEIFESRARSRAAQDEASGG